MSVADDFRAGKPLPLPTIKIPAQDDRPRKEVLLDVYRHKDIGYVPNLFWDYNFLRSRYINEHPIPSDADYSGGDWFGCEWKYNADEDSSAPAPGARLPISDMTEWHRQVTFPDLDAYDWEKIAAEETKNFDRKKKISMVMLESGIFERSHLLAGFEKVMVAMYEEPEAYEGLLDAITEHRLKLIDIVGRYYKPDVLMHHDDFGHQTGMMMSLDMWRMFFKPRLQKLVDRCHSHGMFYEQHSCGYITPLIPEFVEIGVDAINDLQPMNDLEAIKHDYGKQITLCGGFDTRVLDDRGASKKAIRAEVRRTYDALAPGGSYVSMPIVLDYGNCTVPILLEHRKIARSYR